MSAPQCCENFGLTGHKIDTNAHRAGHEHRLRRRAARTGSGLTSWMLILGRGDAYELSATVARDSIRGRNGARAAICEFVVSSLLLLDYQCQPRYCCVGQQHLLCCAAVVRVALSDRHGGQDEILGL